MKTEQGKMLVLDASRLVRKFADGKLNSDAFGQLINGYHHSMQLDMVSQEGPILESIPGWPFRYSDSDR